MARIPTAADIAGPGGFRTPATGIVEDKSAIFSGARSALAGVQDVAAGIAARGEQIRQRQNLADVAKAEAEWTAGTLDLDAELNNSGAYDTFENLASTKSMTLKAKAAGYIRDPEMRQRWEDETEIKRLNLIGAARNRADALADSDARSVLSQSLQTNFKIISDPTVPQVMRDQVTATSDAAIKHAQDLGLIDGEGARQLRANGIEKAQEQLALNRAAVELMPGGNPQKLRTDLAVPSALDSGGQGVVAAVTTANGGQVPKLDYSLAKVTADLLNDANFPDDPNLAEAYLADPDKQAEYLAAASAMLSDRYKGDLTAAIVAMDPEGGTALADKWVASNHDLSVLPAGVEKRYKAAINAYRVPTTGERIPIVTDGGVDLTRTDTQVLGRFEELQTQFGHALPLLSGYRDSEHNKAVGGADASQHLDGRALDIDVSSLSKDERVRFIQMASAMGFTGIGVYNNSVHLDTGARRAWGPDHHAGSVPGWAKDVIQKHISGVSDELPVAYMGVSPDYAALSFDQRLSLAAKADDAMRQQDVDRRASLETVAANAPVAISNTGSYDGDMPTATEFVRAYGADDGIQKFKEFEASIDVAKTTYSMRGMSADEIMAEVEASAPTSRGPDAYLESKKFEAISSAAEATLDAREKDPVGYVMQVFPSVAETVQASGESDAPWVKRAAFDALQTAQEKIGIEPNKIRLLTTGQATASATAFKDSTLPADQRLGALIGPLMQTPDEQQQKMIFDQLIDAGVPEHVQGAVAAMMRGDTGAASRLMRAALVDPDKLGGKLDFSDAAISEAIQAKIFDQNAIGDVIYGITGGGPDALTRAQADSTLIDRAVKLRLIDGSAGGDVNRAIDLTIKDMYGDVQIVTGGGLKITLPTGEDPAPVRSGLAAMSPQVSEALRNDMLSDGLNAFDEASGMRTLLTMGVDNAVDTVMAEGYFVNAGDDQFQFFNPYTGAVIGGKDGKPLTFSKQDVLAAGAQRSIDNYWQDLPYR